MPTFFRAFVRSLVPYGEFGGTGALRTLRFAGAVVASFTPLFGAVYRAAYPDAFDPVMGRVVITGAALALIGFSYADTVVRRRPAESLAATIYTLLGWFGYLSYMNALSPAYAVGYLFVIVASAMVYSVICDSPWPIARMLVVASALGLGIALGVERPGVPPSVFAVCLVPGAIVIYFAFRARLSAVQALAMSEAGLADAEGLAESGSWYLDLRTRRRTWSSGAYRVFGIDPATPPLPLTEVVHPEDLHRLAVDKGRLSEDLDRGDFRYRIVRPDGEIRVIRSIVRTIRDRDGAAIEFRGVFLDITEQTDYEANLQAALERAEAAAAAKTAFLANMSHEIRTPLTAIIGFSQMLREDVGEAHRDLVEPIEAGGRRLLSTLNSVLDLARMEAGETDLDLVPTDVGQEARGVADLLRGQAKAKGLALALDAPVGEAVVLADPAALSRVLTNLLSNAVKFTEAGGVAVAVRPLGGRVEIVVTDTGRGMDDAFLDELFEPFQQASTGWARTHEGTGLGLAITRRLVDAMGGEIHVESQLGVGSRFVLGFPAVAGRSVPATVSAPVPLAA